MGNALRSSARRLRADIRECPFKHRAYDGWNAIQSQALWHDGMYLAYSVVLEESDGQPPRHEGWGIFDRNSGEF
jgi:hypothetical protein